MEDYKLAIILVFGSCFLMFSCRASACLSDGDCLHFEYCCKGNCTWNRLKCEHICQRDHDCGSHSRCVLGICVNCTKDFSCTRKSCLNDSHCPGGHSCQKDLCEVNKKSNLTSEMAPFLIFITALSVSLLIVCYNDYFLERFGRRGWRERLERVSCNCSLTYWFWMRRWRRQQQCNDPTFPAVEVQFESWSNSNNQSNSLNEKPRQTIWTWSSLKRILLSWRTSRDGSERCLSPSNENNSENSTRNIPSSSPVVLLSGFMNTNESVTRLSSSNRQSSSSRVQDLNRSETERNASQNIFSLSSTIVDSNGLATETRTPRFDGQESEVNNHVINTCSAEVTMV